MKKSLWILLLMLLPGSQMAWSQTGKWTLEDCINYAVANNIGLKRQELQRESAETNFMKAKMDVLPSLSFESNADMGFGRSVNPVTNLITFKQNFSNSYSLSSNLELFGGLSTLNTVSANKFMVKAGVEAEKVARNTLVVEILGQYYKVLYARGLEEVTRRQVELSESQLFRIKKMVETGKEAPSKQLEMESRVSSVKLDYTIAYNSANQALTTLKQMLQLEPGTEFDLLVPDPESMLISEGSYSTDSVYAVAAQVLPRLRSLEFELRASKKFYAASKGYISPRLTAGGAIFTGYYKVMNETEEEQQSFRTQFKNNNSQAVWLTLQIPIFNNYTTGRNIKLAKLKRDDTALRLELEKNNLYSEIENACLDYNRGMDEFGAANSNLAFNKKSFSAIEKKFEAGLVDVTDYSAAQTNLYKAEAEALRSRLLVMVRQLAIQLYSTGDYETLKYN